MTNKLFAGVDEVGRGSWAGPVMACAALLDYQTPIDKRLDSLISEGHKVRYYVTYGPEWYAYSIRRMRENPDIWKDTMKAFFFRTKHRR